jgi:hypothetical protein
MNAVAPRSQTLVLQNIQPMLFRQYFLDGIRNGTIKLAFRRWRRPSVRAGGKLLTPVGELVIKALTPVSIDEISAADARNAGYESREALLGELSLRKEGIVYRIEMGPLRADPRIALRESAVDGEELRQLLDRLNRLDARAEGPPWTLRVLKILRDRPGVRAGDLCRLVGQEKEAFKLNVRKLKNLGLTESLETGYRLSPRGEALLRDST